jgi:hypothetical protein
VGIGAQRGAWGKVKVALTDRHEKRLSGSRSRRRVALYFASHFSEAAVAEGRQGFQQPRRLDHVIFLSQ